MLVYESIASIWPTVGANPPLLLLALGDTASSTILDCVELFLDCPPELWTFLLPFLVCSEAPKKSTPNTSSLPWTLAVKLRLKLNPNPLTELSVSTLARSILIFDYSSFSISISSGDVSA